VVTLTCAIRVPHADVAHRSTHVCSENVPGADIEDPDHRVVTRNRFGESLRT